MAATWLNAATSRAAGHEELVVVQPQLTRRLVRTYRCYGSGAGAANFIGCTTASFWHGQRCLLLGAAGATFG